MCIRDRKIAYLMRSGAPDALDLMVGTNYAHLAVDLIAVSYTHLDVYKRQVMGYYCGYLALMGALATGAERVYLCLLYTSRCV